MRSGPHRTVRAAWRVRWREMYWTSIRPAGIRVRWRMSEPRRSGIVGIDGRGGRPPPTGGHAC